MADSKGITARDLLRKEDDRGTRFFSGTRDELIAAGLVRDGDFPGDPACGRYTSHTFHRDGRRVYLRIRSRVASPMTYWLHVGLTREQAPRLRPRSPHGRATLMPTGIAPFPCSKASSTI